VDEFKNAVHHFKSAAASPVKEKYVLQLYIAGSTPRSQRAVINVRRLCQEALKDICDLQVIDIFQQPHLAKDEQILAVPTLIKKLPIPKRIFIGDMSDTTAILDSLDPC